MMSHPDEGMLHAYIDGELPSSEAATLELHVSDCERCSAALAEARGLVAAASRTISALDAAPASGRAAPAVVKRPIGESARPRRAFRVPFARAAALLLLAGGTTVVVNRSGTFAADEAASESARAGFAVPDVATAAESAVLTTPAPVAEQRAQLQSVSPPAAPGASGAQATNPAPTAQKMSPSMAAGSGTDAASRAGSSEPSFTDVARGVAGGTARVGDGAATRVVPAPPPPTASPTRVESSEAAALAITGAAAPLRVTRLRTKSGVVLTLTDEPIRTSFAEDARAARRRAPPSAPMRTTQNSAQAAAASAPAPAMNSYRWTSVEQGRTYTLSGPMTVAELEALALRLGELERMP